MKDLGADTTSAEKDTQACERFLQDAQQQGVPKAARKATRAMRKEAARSIEHALRLARESGTHSILDIERTSQARDFGLATPLSREELQALFGTDKPTAEAARARQKEGALAGLRERWEAAYFTVFEEDKPSGMVFCGHSGD
jgi:hypothetical protein